MKREYSEQEIKRILKQDIEVPDQVESAIQESYAQIGATKQRGRRRRTYTRSWRGVAAVAVLTISSSAMVFAANRFLSANLVHKESKVSYDIQIDKTQEAHEIKVNPTYLPEGYQYGEENSLYQEKIYNPDTKEVISILTYNAAELDELVQLGEEKSLITEMKSENLRKELKQEDSKADLFVTKSEYIDSDKTVKRLLLFNGTDGYLVEIFSESKLPEEELMKIAENLDIKVTDIVVPYKTDEEIQALIAQRKVYENEAGEKILSNCFFNVGEELRSPFAEQSGSDFRYTVESVEIKDKILPSDYPIENYLEYDENVKDWVNEDGSLKPHARYVDQLDESGNKTEDSVVETVHSKYVIVKMKLRNNSLEKQEYNEEAYVAPFLKKVEIKADGTYGVNSREIYRSANENYMLQTDGMPIYFDSKYYTSGIEGKKHALFIPLELGEEIEYTLIYVVDEDQVDTAYLEFYSEYGGWTIEEGKNDKVFVRIQENKETK